VLIATDSEEIAKQAKTWGARAIMTSEDCSCGTERIASMVDQLDAEIIINVQGDEPLIDPDLIDELGRRANESGADMVTPVVKITDPEVLMSATTVKVVIREDGTALYFSRSAVPFVRDVAPERWIKKNDFWLQVGTYAFRKDVLLEYLQWTETGLEKMERIEQLRFLEAGKTIQTFETHVHSMAVDTPEDLGKVRKIMAA
jgi:3-deoxy-manno-octulosonate cytidylyltransferase (CMP-KDO synthetase)